MIKTFKPGDRVVYRVTKHTTRPGPRAKAIEPAQRGEHYRYEVDKFWVVEASPDGEHVVLRTRRGKLHTLTVHDAKLRHASWWERLWFRDRFPTHQ